MKKMSFPLLPQLLSSNYHQYDRLNENIQFNLNRNSFKIEKNTLFQKLTFYFKKSNEKFLLICNENGKINELNKIIKRHPELMNPSYKYLIIEGIHEASYSGFLETVIYLIEELNFPIDSTTKDGHTALHLACMKGHLEIVTYLCQHGASVSATTDDGATPLHWASVRGNYDCVRYLLEHTNSNPQSVTKAGFTALHYACIVGNIHIARLLIYEYGVSVDCINEDNDTPLHFACFQGIEVMIKFLVHSMNANIRLKDKAGYTPLHLLVIKGWVKYIPILLSSSQSDLDLFNPEDSVLFEVDQTLSTPLHLACQFNQSQCIKELIQPLHNISPLLCSEYISRKNKDGRTCVHIAAKYNSSLTLQSLYNNYKQLFSFEVIDNFLQTPLHLAVRNGHYELTVQLVESYEANIFATNINGENSLHLACMKGHGRIVQYLVQSGIELQQQTKSGHTPLYLACYYGHTEIVNYLLHQEGMDREKTQDRDQSSPLIIASSQGHLGLVEYLLDRIMVSLFTTDVVGRTCLHWSCINGHTKVTEFLVDYANSLNVLKKFMSIRDYDGNQALEVSTSNEIESLLSNQC